MSDTDLENREFILSTGEILPEAEFVRLAQLAYTRQGRKDLGQEYPDPTPMEPPLGYVPHVPLIDQIRAMVQRELGNAANAEGFETPEEADDFEVGEDYDPRSPYEVDWDPTAPWPPRFDAEPTDKPNPPPSDPSAGGSGAEPPPSPGPAGPEPKAT